MFCFEFLCNPRLDAACLIFFDYICFCRFVYCRVEAWEEFICIIKFACDNKFFDFFQSFFILVAPFKVLAVSQAGLAERFDCCFGDWHTKNIAENEKFVKRLLNVPHENDYYLTTFIIRP